MRLGERALTAKGLREGSSASLVVGIAGSAEKGSLSESELKPSIAPRSAESYQPEIEDARHPPEKDIMRISIDVGLNYRFPRPNTVLLTLEAARTEEQTIVREELNVGDVELTRIVGDAGVGERLWARVPGREIDLTYRALVDISRPRLAINTLDAAPLHAIPGEIAPYLRPSRYCQSDKFIAFVEKRFGHLVGGEKVSAIRDWIEAQLTYVPGSSDSDTNVLETFAARQGVCRDYAHLMCAMVRAAQIPARMVAAYSPDIVPPDFHALAEIWLGGKWHLVDPTGMSTADSTAVIAVGRDAYDIAFMDSEAPAEMLSQSILVTRA